jgi:hypothetical protein
MAIGSVDDERVGNSPTRHQYRILTDEEKQTISDIKDAGQLLIDAIEKTKSAANIFATLLTRNLEQDDDSQVAMMRLLEGMGGLLDKNDQIDLVGQDLQIVKIKEASMWAVRSVTS